MTLVQVDGSFPTLVCLLVWLAYPDFDILRFRRRALLNAVEVYLHSPILLGALTGISSLTTAFGEDFGLARSVRH